MVGFATHGGRLREARELGPHARELWADLVDGRSIRTRIQRRGPAMGKGSAADTRRNSRRAAAARALAIRN